MSQDAGALAAALHYASCGLSVLPVTGGKRPALDSWKLCQRTIADEATIRDWFSDSTLGVGVVGGAVSGNLAVLDCDDAGFSEWVEQKVASMLGHTWVVRTGSGKIHVYLRGFGPTRSTIVRSPGGPKLADMRAEGEYVVAPPSPHLSGGYYTTLSGGPDHIASAKDPPGIYDRLARLYALTFPAPTENGRLRPAHEHLYADKTIMSPLSGTPRAELIAEVRNLGLLRKNLDALLEGAFPGDPGWEGARSPSEIVYSVVANLVERGAEPPRIEEAFATFAVGESHYRNEEKPNYGRGWLYRAIDRSLTSIDKSKAAGERAEGENFRIIDAERVEFEEPTHDLRIINDDGDERTVTVSHDAFYARTELKFLKELGKAMHGMPKLRPEHMGRNFDRFADIVLRMEHEKEVAADATGLGQIREYIVAMLRRSDLVLPEVSADLEGALGWREASEHVIYLRGGDIIRRLTLELKPPPSPERIWTVIRRMGGEERVYRYGNGQRERMWIVPLQTVRGPAGP